MRSDLVVARIVGRCAIRLLAGVRAARAWCRRRRPRVDRRRRTHVIVVVRHRDSAISPAVGTGGIRRVILGRRLASKRAETANNTKNGDSRAQTRFISIHHETTLYNYARWVNQNYARWVNRTLTLHPLNLARAYDFRATCALPRRISYDFFFLPKRWGRNKAGGTKRAAHSESPNNKR